MVDQPLFVSSLPETEDGYPQVDESQYAAQPKPAYGAGEDDAPGKMFIGGLSWETTQEGLKNYFSKFGEIVDCIVMKDPLTGRSRGFGFITFADPRHCDDVMQSGPHVLDQRTAGAAPQKPVQQEKTKKVFIGGLPYETTEDQLREFFSKYGKVDEVILMYDRETKRPRGFGFITFESDLSVDKLCEEHFVKIGEKQVEIKRAEPKSAIDAQKMRHGGFGNTRGGRGGRGGRYPMATNYQGRYTAGAYGGYGGYGSYGGYAGYPAGSYAAYDKGEYMGQGMSQGMGQQAMPQGRYGGGYGAYSDYTAAAAASQGGRGFYDNDFPREAYEDYGAYRAAAAASYGATGSYGAAGARYAADPSAAYGGYYPNMGANYDQGGNYGPTRSTQGAPQSGYRPY